MRPDPTCSWYVWILGSIGESTRDACLQGELFCRRLSFPTLPLCPDPTCPWYVRVWNSTSHCESEKTLAESQTRTYHGQIRSKRTASGVENDRTPTKQFALDTSVFRILQCLPDTSSFVFFKRLCLSNPKPRHITSRSGRGASRSGQAGSSKIDCQQS